MKNWYITENFLKITDFFKNEKKISEFCVKFMLNCCYFMNTKGIYIMKLKKNKKNSQGPQNKSRISQCVTLFLAVRKNSFYDKMCLFTKRLIWHRSARAEMCGNRRKTGFRFLPQKSKVEWHLILVHTLFTLCLEQWQSDLFQIWGSWVRASLQAITFFLFSFQISMKSHFGN